MSRWGTGRLALHVFAAHPNLFVDVIPGDIPTLLPDPEYTVAGTAPIQGFSSSLRSAVKPYVVVSALSAGKDCRAHTLFDRAAGKPPCSENVIVTENGSAVRV